ncbi:MAG: hypothetical protein Q7U64_03055 [Desulfocapsaceae bacterium]|nr:hypothetical protein [Desulfocapsaceae bacterium]
MLFLRIASFNLTDRHLTAMEDTGGKCRLDIGLLKDINKMLGRSGGRW